MAAIHFPCLTALSNASQRQCGGFRACAVAAYGLRECHDRRRGRSGSAARSTTDAPRLPGLPARRGYSPAVARLLRDRTALTETPMRTPCALGSPTSHQDASGVEGRGRTPVQAEALLSSRP